MTTTTERKAHALNRLQDAAQEAEYFRVRHLRSKAHLADLDAARDRLARANKYATGLGTTFEARTLAMHRGRDAARLELGYEVAA